MKTANFSYLVGQPPAAINSADPRWRAALPLDRRRAAAGPLPAGHAFAYGDYFTAASQFLLHADMAVVVSAATILTGRNVSPADIDHIAVHLAKHGAFYHPARVVVTVDSDRLSLVLNVAVSEPGRTAVTSEYAALERLNGQCRGFLPRVFGRGTGRVGAFDVALFAAEWLEEFCEFHLGHTPEGTLQWQLWGEAGERWTLTAAQVAVLYRQAACILTACFNPLTFESISGWHHAAGDFVLKPGPDQAAVRLITVRRYAPLFTVDTDEPPELEKLLDGLAAFFIDMSLRMRIDRLDGVGELAWAPDSVISPVWEGFGAGLAQMAAYHELPPELGAMVGQYLAAHPPRELKRLGRRIAARYPSASGERRLIEHHLGQHLDALADIMLYAPIG